MTSGGKTLVRVNTEQHVHMLREYRNLLQSTIGPNGSCKAIVTGGGYLEVTSNSATLAARLQLASPICNYINNMVAGLADHGLYCGILLSHLLEQQWQECKFSKSNNTQIIADFVQELKTLFISDNVCVKFDFSSIQNFLPLVRTIIMSKCSVLLCGMDVDRICIEIIRVFLNCVDEERSLLNRVYTKVESGPNTFTSYKGLLYTLTENDNIEIARGLTSDIKILVFVLKLQDIDENFSAFEKFKQILEHSVKFGVKVVACQKTVSSEFKLFLKRRKILLLERMGTDFTNILIDLSRAFPISQLNIKESEIDKVVGHLSLIEHIQFNERDYLVLHNTNLPVGTLLIQTSTLLGEDFVKTLVLQALTSLRMVAVHPLLIIGGGCLESWLIGQIHLLKGKKKDKYFNLISSWVQRALQSTCSVVELDNLYHHGWREDEDSCSCRLVKKREVERGGGTWLTLGEVVNSQVNLQKPQQPNMTLRPDVLVESHHLKLQVICSVFETFANLSDIGLILYDN